MKRSEELINDIQRIIGDCQHAIEQSQKRRHIAFQREEKMEMRRVEMLTARLKEIKLSIQKTLDK